MATQHRHVIEDLGHIAENHVKTLATPPSNTELVHWLIQQWPVAIVDNNITREQLRAMAQDAIEAIDGER